MGWQLAGVPPGWDPLAKPGDLMDVIGAMRERRYDCEITIETWGPAVTFTRGADDRGFRREPSVRGDWRGALAKAVCRAALEAVKS
jgi:hypothetical protein